MTRNGLQAFYFSKVLIPQLEIRHKMSKTRSAIIFITNTSSTTPLIGNSINGSLSKLVKFLSLGLSYELSDMIDVMIYEVPQTDKYFQNSPEKADSSCLRDVGFNQ